MIAGSFRGAGVWAWQDNATLSGSSTPHPGRSPRLGLACRRGGLTNQRSTGQGLGEVRLLITVDSWLPCGMLNLVIRYREIVLAACYAWTLPTRHQQMTENTPRNTTHCHAFLSSAFGLDGLGMEASLDVFPQN